MDPRIVEPKTFLELALKVGVPLALVAGILYWLTTSVTVDLRAVAASEQDTKNAVVIHAKEMHDESRATRALLYAICRGVNKTDEARELCEVGR